MVMPAMEELMTSWKPVVGGGETSRESAGAVVEGCRDRHGN
jgi:hypothetical protein